MEININYLTLYKGMQCEMCGKDSNLLLTKVEGTILKLCGRCARYGEVMKRVVQEQIKVPESNLQFVKKGEENEEMIVENYAEIIKAAREKKGIKQEDFAKKINEKESLVHHLETGRMEPGMKLARKLEHFLEIKLVEDVKFQDYRSFSENKKQGELTLGDIIKVRKRA